jgi:2-oxoglutarate dehydrogenase E2 component (dihydrolipoamide succinyltransferase)
MAKFEILMPKMGESIIEATITKWLKNEGDTISEEDAIVEIATDKVDSEIPSPVDGILVKRLYNEGDTVAVGEVIAYISTGDDDEVAVAEAKPVEKIEAVASEAPAATPAPAPQAHAAADVADERFYSPLVKSIAKQEGIPAAELASIGGSGKDGRVTKTDILAYISGRGQQTQATAAQATAPASPASPTPAKAPSAPATVFSGPGDQIVEMDRMRRIIADHMVNSVHTSPHVTSFVEVDMTNIVKWRNKHKDAFEKREGIRLTFTHVFLEAIAKAIKEFPMVNASVDGNNIIIRRRVNIGMAVALPSGNLIVPVVKDVDEKNLLGVAKQANDLAERARDNKLLPDEIQGGTITLTNLGSFGTVMGTPIINQPQLAIVAVGSITKRPVVIETREGDLIGIRHMMYLSLSYDHRVIDGALGGKFIYRVKELLEQFDTNRSV